MTKTLNIAIPAATSIVHATADPERTSVHPETVSEPLPDMNQTVQGRGGLNGLPVQEERRRVSRSTNVADRNGVRQRPVDHAVPGGIRGQRPEPDPGVGAVIGAPLTPTPHLANSPAGAPDRSSLGSLHEEFLALHMQRTQTNNDGPSGSVTTPHETNTPSSRVHKYILANWNAIDREEVQRNDANDREDALNAVARQFPSRDIPRQTGFNYYINPRGREYPN